MAWFDGRESCSYLLDRAVNFVPEPMEFGYERDLGRHALCFTCQDPYGRAMELVMMRDGGGFDLLERLLSRRTPRGPGGPVRFRRACAPGPFFVLR